MQAESRVAVLVDCDNTSPEVLEHALRVVAQFGRVVLRRGYGNHSTLANKWQEALVRLAFTPCLQYQYASGKNTSDIALALDAMEALFDDRADTFCLVTSDSDFAYAITKLGWSREQRVKLNAQAREVPRQFVERESHHLWGRRYLLSVIELDEKAQVLLSHRRMTLQVRPGSSAQKRAEVMHEWHKAQLHAVVPGLIRKWERKLGVRVSGYFLQRMKTKWGSCNPHKHHVRLNTELVKKPKDLLEYVVVHEMVHLIEPSHNERFLAMLDRHWPQWRESRAELNALPLGCESWPT